MNQNEDFRRDMIEEFRNQLAQRSRNKLAISIERKFKTTFIGALSYFEKEFEELWGFSEPIDSLTQEQKEERQRWTIVRDKILDNGNRQLRYLLEELKQYRVELGETDIFIAK